MNGLIIKHVLIQFCLVAIYIENEAVVNLINNLIKFVGVNPSDTHLSLGVYVFAFLSFILPLVYLAFTEYVDKKRLAQHLNFWVFRIEVFLLTALGIIIFMS